MSSSPWRNTYDSPSRQLYSESRQQDGSSPARSCDSPSKQLLEEFQKMMLSSVRESKLRLDQQTREQERIHQVELAAAAAEHERIRRNAEAVKALHDLQIQQAREQEEKANIKELERRRQARAEEQAREQRRKLEQLEREEAERQEAARLAQEIAAKEASNKAERTREAEESLQRRKESEDTARAADQAERDRKAREVAEAATKPTARIAQPQASSSSNFAPPTTSQAQQGLTSTSLISPVEAREAVHQKYVDLHRRLKKLRQHMTSLRAQFPEIKAKMGDMRREIVKSVGQLTIAGKNQIPTEKVLTILRSAVSINQPYIDVREFIVQTTTPPIAQDSEAQVPILLIFLLNSFSKAVIKQLISEGGVNPEHVDPIGILCAKVFSDEQLKWRGIPLNDILLAKYHVVCPVVFGISGSDKTEAGRKRLGWWRDGPGGPWVPEQVHGERMTGLGAGFGALFLRQFPPTRQNPFPNREYWRAVAFITNTPPEQATETHFIVLRAMVQKAFVMRFVKFYGMAGKVALRRALVEFPRAYLQTKPKSVAANAVALVTEVLKKDLHLTLA